jgi:hypothetical protein
VFRGDIITFFTAFSDGNEIVEDYNLNTEELVSRRVKKVSMTGKEQWFVEIGSEPVTTARKDDDFLIKENQNNPIFIRKDNANDFQFRVRNSNSTKDNFIVECDKDKNQIVIKTKNKKYYKRFGIPDLERIGASLDENMMKVNFVNNTLVISYKKPEEILRKESEILADIRKIKAETKAKPEAKYDTECKNQ